MITILHNKKLRILLLGFFLISLVLNAALIHNTLSLRNYLKNEYIEGFSNFNELASSDYDPTRALGFLGGVGGALDKQFRYDYTKEWVHHLIVSELGFIIRAENYSTEEKSDAINIFYKHIISNNINDAYYKIRQELKEKQLDDALPPVAQL